MVDANVTARGFWEHAKAFSDAADVVHTSTIVDPLPKYFLWGRAIELFLKSFLLIEGISTRDLAKKPFGHNLERIFREARDRGILNLVGENLAHLGIVEIMNLDYMSKRLEYPEPNSTNYLTHVRQTQGFIKRLRKGIDYHMRTKKQ